VPDPHAGTPVGDRDASIGWRVPARGSLRYPRAKTVSVMNDIHGIQPPAAPSPIEPTQALARGAAASEPLNITDTVEISEAARLAAKVQELPEIRAELVQRVKAELAAGTYETPERLEIAVDRLMDELFPHL